MSGRQLDRVARSVLRAQELLRLLDSDRRPATVEQVVAGLHIELAIQRDNLSLLLDEAGLSLPTVPTLTPRRLPAGDAESLF